MALERLCYAASSYGGEQLMSYDTDAQAYITAVESADTQALELGVKNAINAFVVGCKADGIWSAIKASCIMAGARTLDGALTPLVGPAPTNVGSNFVSGDYDRKTGLKADGGTSGKYLDSNVDGATNSQDNFHMSVFMTEPRGAGTGSLIGNGNSASGTWRIGGNNADQWIVRVHSNSAVTLSGTSQTQLGFVGVSRAIGSSFDFRRNNGTTSHNISSQAPLTGSGFVFAARDFSNRSSARLPWYSIGESLDLALLDARLATLMTALGDDVTYATSSLRRNHAFIGVAF
jgi:hypothetical protein